MRFADCVKNNPACIVVGVSGVGQAHVPRALAGVARLCSVQHFERSPVTRGAGIPLHPRLEQVNNTCRELGLSEFAAPGVIIQALLQQNFVPSVRNFDKPMIELLSSIITIHMKLKIF